MFLSVLLSLPFASFAVLLNCSYLTCGIKLHNSESYKAGMFIAAPGARGIAPPNLHTKSRSVHLFITKLI